MNSDLEYRVHHPIDNELLAEVGRLRVEAWATVVPEAACMETWIDNQDADAYHWTVWDGPQLIASARLSAHDCIEAIPDADLLVSAIPDTTPVPICSINRLVVNHRYRGNGIAKTLDELRIKQARRLGCKSVVGTPINNRVEQLLALGFQQVAISHGPISHGPISHGPISHGRVPILVLEL